MRLLFVINQLFKGGAETSLVTMLKNLDPRKYNVDVVVFEHVQGIDAICLIPEIPSWINTFVQNRHFLQKILDLLENKYSRKLLNFISGKHYDLAVSFGEWFSPELVMKYVHASRKAVWLHSDIAQSLLVNFDELFRYDYCTDFYICVSKLFAEHTVAQFPFLRDKAVVIHNCSDIAKIRDMAEEKPVKKFADERNTPCILSVGNLRPEKNYLRAIEAAAILKKKKIPFRWYCAGTFSHEMTVNDIKAAIAKNGLTKDFILLGPQDNPYSLMKQASVLVSSSDHESWSMVISEAKILGLPVITTKTDGACEQLMDGVNSYFCDFSAESIAEKLQLYLGNSAIPKKFRAALLEKKSSFSVENELQAILTVPQKRNADILFVIDNANYNGGAHAAIRYLMQKLVEKGYRVEVFSGVNPTVEVRNLFAPIPVVSLDIQQIAAWEEIPFRKCLFSSAFSVSEKISKFKRAVGKRLFPKQEIWKKNTSILLQRFFSGYKRVCVMSEGSIFRKEVSLCSCPLKFQMIHTNYAQWRDFSDYTRNLTIFDSQFYSKMDGILLISQKSKESFLDIFPAFQNKSFAVKNIIHAKPMQKKQTAVASPIRLLTIARLEAEKDIPRMLSIALRLKNEGILFDWTILGTSTLLDDYRVQAEKSGVGDVFHFRGQVRDVSLYFEKADLFLLLSHYEGLPNTVYEAMISGVPVLATAVGGIPEQIEDGVSGFLVADDEEAIFQKLVDLCLNPDKILSVGKNLMNYQYDNEKILQDYVRIFKL